MILVVGGTGLLGRDLVSRFVAAGVAVRVLTRTRTPSAAQNAEVVEGNVLDTESLRRAVRGCDTVVAAMHGFLGGRRTGPPRVDGDGTANLVTAATAEGASRVVLLSVLGASLDHPMELFRAKFAAEQHLRASNLDWTIIRPTAYMETWTQIIGAKLPNGPALVFGNGTNPINFVSVKDVASIAERTVTDPNLIGVTIDTPGPQNLTMNEFAQQLGASKIKNIPRSVLRVLATTATPIAPAFARRTRTALAMDTLDMSFDPAAAHARFPDISWHRLADIAQTASR